MASSTAVENHFDAWWLLLRDHLERVRPTLPRSPQGIIQFEGCEDARGFGYVRVDGPKTVAANGVHASPDAWVELRGADLATFVEQGHLPDGSIQYVGDQALVDTFTSALDDSSQKSSWLGLRTTESQGGWRKKR